MSFENLNLENNWNGENINTQYVSNKENEISSLQKNIKDIAETKDPKISEKLLAGNTLQGDINNFLETAANNDLASHLSEFNANSFDKDWEDWLDKFEFENFVNALDKAIDQIIILDWLNKFWKIHKESENSDFWRNPDKFIAKQADIQELILWDENWKSFTEEWLQKLNLSEEELTKMSEKKFDVSSKESWKEMWILLWKELGNWVEDILRFLWNIPSGIILIPRYTNLRMDINSSDPKIATEWEIKIQELVEDNPSLWLLNLLWEQWVEMIKKLGEMIMSWKQGDIAMMLVTIAGLLAWWAGLVKVWAKWAKMSKVESIAANVQKWAERVDDIVWGAGIWHITTTFSTKRNRDIKVEIINKKSVLSDFDRFEKSDLVNNILTKSPELKPINEIEVNWKNFAFSKVINNWWRLEAIWYVEKNWTLEARLFYKSNSDWWWRSSPWMRNDWAYSKGEMIKNHSYTTTTKVDPKIDNFLNSQKQEPWDEISKFFWEVSKEYEVTYPVNGKAFKNEVSWVNLDHFNENNLQPWYLKNVNAKNNNEFIKLLTSLNYEKWFLPNFKKISRSYEFDHTIAWKTRIDVFQAKLNWRDIEWHFAQADSNPNQIWISNIRYKDTKISSFWTDKDFINSWVLTSKPFEYWSQIPNFLKWDNNHIVGTKYYDITEALWELKPIKEYKLFLEKERINKIKTPDIKKNSPPSTIDNVIDIEAIPNSNKIDNLPTTTKSNLFNTKQLPDTFDKNKLSQLEDWDMAMIKTDKWYYSIERKWNSLEIKQDWQLVNPNSIWKINERVELTDIIKKADLNKMRLSKAEKTKLFDQTQAAKNISTEAIDVQIAKLKNMTPANVANYWNKVPKPNKKVAAMLFMLAGVWIMAPKDAQVEMQSIKKNLTTDTEFYPIKTPEEIRRNSFKKILNKINSLDKHFTVPNPVLKLKEKNYEPYSWKWKFWNEKLFKFLDPTNSVDNPTDIEKELVVKELQKKIFWESSSEVDWKFWPKTLRQLRKYL